MNFGKIKKLALASALALTVGVTASAAGCSIATDHPHAKITFQLVKGEGAKDVQDFTIEYTLYRNMYPQTVKHFIELSKAGFYNDMIVHDYSTGEWVTGLYEYKGYQEYSAAIENSGSMSDYFDDYSKDEEYIALFNKSALTASVYGNIDSNGNKQAVNKKYALPTVIGEFRKNIQQEIQNGALTSTSGCLKMFYYPESSSSDASDKKIYVTPTSDQIIRAEMKYNSATSAFAVQLGSSSYSYTDYCVFGKVTSEDALDKLKKAVEDWFAELSDNSSDHYVTSSASVAAYVPKKDGGFDTDSVNVSFNAPKKAIVIKSVKITKN